MIKVNLNALVIFLAFLPYSPNLIPFTDLEPFCFLICFLTILVNVDNEIITSYDLKNQIKTLIILSNREINQNNIDKTKKIALNNLVNLMIKKIEVNKFDIQIDDNSVSNYLNTVSNGDIDNLKKIFFTNNLNFESYRNNIEIELRWQKLIVSKFNIYQ